MESWLYVIVFVLVILGVVGAVGMANSIRRKRDTPEDQDIYR